MHTNYAYMISSNQKEYVGRSPWITTKKLKRIDKLPFWHTKKTLIGANCKTSSVPWKQTPLIFNVEQHSAAAITFHDLPINPTKCWNVRKACLRICHSCSEAAFKNCMSTCQTDSRILILARHVDFLYKFSIHILFPYK